MENADPSKGYWDSPKGSHAFHKRPNTRTEQIVVEFLVWAVSREELMEGANMVFTLALQIYLKVVYRFVVVAVFLC